ncbi:MAG: GGDEF domain-containing protein [Oscillibacter sp.]|nr:GGDEF domain-containing protein [Oscillibacter sp.]
MLQRTLKKWKKFWKCGIVKPEVQQEIDRENMRFGLLVAMISGFFEILILIRYGIFGNRDSGWYWQRLYSYLVFFFSSTGMSVFASLALRGKVKSHRRIAFVGMAYCLIALGWSMFISGVDYSRDGQILVFCTVVLGCAGFSFWRPSRSIFLYLITGVSFYAVLYRIDGAYRVNVYNYLIFFIVCFLVNASRYHMKVDSTTAQMKLEKMGRRFRKLSLYDELTGVLNRRSLFLLQEECMRQPLFLMMMDLDDFKKVNDMYGHSVGDEVLRQFASILRHYFTAEAVYRYGGEEFVVALCSPELPAVLEKFEKARADAAQIAMEKQSLPITFSGGYALAEMKDRETFEQLLKAADMALYKAKHRGKNQIMAAEEEDFLPVSLCCDVNVEGQTALAGCFLDEES